LGGGETGYDNPGKRRGETLEKKKTVKQGERGSEEDMHKQLDLLNYNYFRMTSQKKGREKGGGSDRGESDRPGNQRNGVIAVAMTPSANKSEKRRPEDQRDVRKRNFGTRKGESWDGGE